MGGQAGRWPLAAPAELPALAVAVAVKPEVVIGALRHPAARAEVVLSHLKSSLRSWLGATGACAVARHTFALAGRLAGNCRSRRRPQPTKRGRGGYRGDDCGRDRGGLEIAAANEGRRPRRSWLRLGRAATSPVPATNTVRLPRLDGPSATGRFRSPGTTTVTATAKGLDAG